VHTDDEAVKVASRRFDCILDTVSSKHPIAPLMNTLKVGGTYVLIGCINPALEVLPMQMLFHRQSLEGSLIGGIAETQEMLDFCAQHNIVPEYKVITAKEANAHFQSLLAGTADAIRAVIDISTLKSG